MGGYHCTGKQVLNGREHVADAIDNDTAQMIADALNLFTSNTDPDFQPVAFVDMQPVKIAGHMIRREGDEYVCSTCNPPIRWDVSEGDDHP